MEPNNHKVIILVSHCEQVSMLLSAGEVVTMATEVNFSQTFCKWKKDDADWSSVTHRRRKVFVKRFRRFLFVRQTHGGFIITFDLPSKPNELFHMEIH